MNFKQWICFAIVILLTSACGSMLESPVSIDAPTEANTVLPTKTASPTPLPTLTSTRTPTSTATPFPKPEGESVSDPLLNFNFFGPADYEISSGIYRRDYAFAAIYQKTTHWTNAMILIDMDVSDQPDLPLSLILATALTNLDFFNAAAEETGEPYPIEINLYEAVAVDFTGETQGVSIQGQIIGFEPDPDRVFLGIAWSDIAKDPDSWENYGAHLFQFVLQSVRFPR